MSPAAPVIASIVHEHAQEAIALCLTRLALVNAPGLRLPGLERHDERLAAHLDGLAVAGEFGWRVCEAALYDPGVGEGFLATVRAIEGAKDRTLAELTMRAELDPALCSGLIAAFGWVSPAYLEGKIKACLSSPKPFLRRLGISACLMHRVDPGKALDAAFADPDLPLRALGFHAAGQCGRRDLSGPCLRALVHEEPACRFGAARSGVLLGDREAASFELQRFASTACPNQRQAMRLALKAIDNKPGHALLHRLAQDPEHERLLIEGAGMAGDARYVEWLIDRMHFPRMARVAGEAFTYITGLDIGKTHMLFDREAPADFASGPTDNPADDDVAMDEDEGLPWPDPAKLQAWWKVNHERFQPGVRYFLGAPPSVAHCRQVLRDGYQRQRIAAAEYLCLLTPGTPLFPTSAPAWRQQRWLRQMG